MPLTLKELTQRLAAVSGESTDTLNRQLRSWTEGGALPLVGDLFIGTGKSRLYEDDAVLLAAVAVELARWGIPIGKIRTVLMYIWSMFILPNHLGSHEMKEIKNGRSDLVMLIFPFVEQKGVNVALIERGKLSRYSKGEGGEIPSSVLMLDLPQLWTKLR
jgi:hypothetical protein